MTRQRRYRSRQGVVYGPYQARDGARTSGGMLIGQVLGLIVVIAAVAVLGVGALSLIGGDEGVAVASPSPTSAAASLPAATPSAAPRTVPPASAPPSPTIAIPGASLTPGPSLEPFPSGSASPLSVEVRVGPGYVTFGTDRNSRLRITNPRTDFGLDERVLWSAALSEPADTWLLNSRVFKVDPATGSERLVDERGERARVAGAELVSSSLIPRRRLDGPGIYVMRYTRGSQLLSEGYFRVTDN